MRRGLRSFMPRTLRKAAPGRAHRKGVHLAWHWPSPAEIGNWTLTPISQPRRATAPKLGSESNSRLPAQVQRQPSVKPCDQRQRRPPDWAGSVGERLTQRLKRKFGSVPDYLAEQPKAAARGHGLMSENVPPVRPERVAPASALAARVARLSIPLRQLWWAAFVLLGISASAVGWTIWELRSDAIRAAIAESGNIAAVLASQLSRSINGVDSVLLETKRASKDLDIDTPISFRTAFNRRTVRDALVDKLSRLPQAFNIAIADKDGQLTVSTAGWPAAAINIADRDYFKDARDRVDGE